MTPKNLDWAEKYRPASLLEIAGNKSMLASLREWAQQWERGMPEERAVVLYGKPGTGKTTAAHALAREMNWDVIELNASDQRTADIIQRIAGRASRMGTFEGTAGRRLIVLDEADNLFGNADRGGERAIIEVIKETGQPVVLIANDFYAMSQGLRGVCKPVQFSAVQARSMLPVLRKICQGEGVACGPGVLERIAENANGDLRSAINDLQAAAQGKKQITVDDIVTGERDIKETVFKVIAKVLKGRNLREAHESTYNIDESPEDLIHWVDENIPIEYRDIRDIAAGYRCLSRADMYLGRVMRRQNYRMWKYASLLMTGCVMNARRQEYKGFTKFQPPSMWKRLARTRGMRGVRDSAASKIGSHCHVSTRYARVYLFNLFRALLGNEASAVATAALLCFDQDEIAFLLDKKPTSKEVKSIHEAASSLIEKEAEHDIEVFGGFSGARGAAAEPQEEEKEEAGKEEDMLRKDEKKKGAQRMIMDF